MEVPEKPLVSPHPSARVLSRISSFHRPRTRLQLPPIPPRSPPAINRQDRREEILEARRRFKVAAKRTGSMTEFTLRAMRQAAAQRRAEEEHDDTLTGTDAATNGIGNGDNNFTTRDLADILPHQVGPRDKYSRLPASPQPAFSLSPTYRIAQAEKTPVLVSPVMYRGIVKRSMMVPTKMYDGRRAERRERVLDWEVATPMKKRYGKVDIAKKKGEECS